MQRLRVLNLGALAALLVVSAAAADEASKPEKLKTGDTLSFEEALPRVLPDRGSTKLMPRAGRPLALLFWGRNSQLSREAFVEMAAFVRENELLKRMDVYAVASYKEDSQKPEDLREAAIMERVTDLPVLIDEGFTLSRLVGAQQFPEIALFDREGRFLIRGIQGLDHGRLGPKQLRASELISLLAEEGSFDPIPRAFRAFPADRLVGRKYVDFELPRFHPEGWGKGQTERLSSLLSGTKPAVLFFFSSTCKHCQVDIPQLVAFAKENPDLFDLVGVTRIKDDRHRSISDGYFKAQGIEFPVLEDLGSVSELYRVTSTPTSFFMSPAGRISKVTYFQHVKLADDFMKYYGMLMGAPPPLPVVPDRGWHFPLAFKDPEGKPVQLASVEGEPAIVHFWATWCLPCREELPGLMRRLPALESKSKVFIVSVDEDPSKIEAYQKTSGLSFPSYHSPSGGLAEQIDFARSVPRTYVLDANGRLTRLLAGSYDWDDPDRFVSVVSLLSK